jgi:hypothetical protein
MSTKIESLARRMVAELARMTDSRPRKGRVLASIALEMDVDWDTALAAAHLSEERGWLVLHSKHSVSLTEAGLQFVAHGR